MKPLQPKTSFLNFFRLLFRNTAGEAILLPFTKGKRWDSFAARIPANYYQYRKGSIRSVKRDGFELELDISDYMQWLLYFGVQTEPRSQLYSLVKPGMKVMDVGANIGETAMMFSRLTGPNGKVYAFEPYPSTYQHLFYHLEQNKCENVTAIPVALGDKETKLFLGNNPYNTAGNSVSDSGGQEVAVTTGDHFIEAYNTGRIDFIKMDVEGYEYHVLSGCTQLLKRDKPILFVEAVDEFLRKQNRSTKELVALLEQHGYLLTNAYDGKTITPSDDFSETHFDIIARPA